MKIPIAKNRKEWDRIQKFRKEFLKKMKDIPGYENLYAATEDGKIWGYKRGQFLATRFDKDGYERVNLYREGKPRTFGVHRLVALTYIPNPENKPEVEHKNRDRAKNCVDNLTWVTHAENMKNSECGKGRKVGKAKPIYCVELDKTFPS